MSKKLRMTALLAVLMVILVLAIGLVACNPKTNTYKVTTQFNAEQGDVVLAPEAKDGNYEEGTMVTVSVTAKSGYEFDALTVNTDENAALNNEGKYIFKVTADTQITVLFRSVAPAACEHKNLSALVEGKAATCMEAGVIAHYHCNDCGKDLAEDKTTILESTVINIEPTAHKYGAMQDLKPATCSATGIKAHKDCELCHKHFDAEGKEIPEAELTIEKDDNAHNLGTLINGTPATCSAKGEKAHYHCSLCNKDIAEDKTTILDSIEINIDPTAHKYGEMQQQKDATCAVAGTKAHKDCELCGKHFSEQNVEIPDNELTIPATGKHTYDKLVNGGEQGHEVHCSVCDAKQSETLTPHTYGTEYVQDGVQGHHQECACGYKTETKAHEKGNNPYTDYEGETHSFECEKCGRKVTDEHTMGAWQDDGEGKHYKACVCGKETEHGEHNYGDAPVYTDAKDGQHHTVVCTVCQVTVTQKHTTRLASDEESGHHTECTLCTYKSETKNHDLKYEQISAIQHADGSIGEGGTGSKVYAHREICECGYKTQLAKCNLEYKNDADGHWQNCSVCEKSPTDGEKTQHTITTLFDNTEDGYHWKGCRDCGYVQGEKEKHSFDESVYKEYSQAKHYNPCKYEGCGYKGHNQQDHTYGEPTDYKPAVGAEKTQHTATQVCTKCNHNGTIKEAHIWGEKQTTEDGLYEYYICTKCQEESEHKATEHVHQSETGTWATDSTTKKHYQTCDICKQRFNEHDPKYTLNDGWYEGEGKCEYEGCTISIYTFASGTITKYTGSFDKIKLPSSIGGVSVTAVGTKGATAASKSAFYKNQYVTNIILPETITTIYPYAFAWAPKLVEIDLTHVTSIGKCAFNMESTSAGKTALKKAVVNAEIPDSMFKNCILLETVICKENVTKVNNNAFYACKALKTLVFECSMVPTVKVSGAFTNASTNFTVYYKFSKEVYDNRQSNITNSTLLKATKKYYYATKPSESGLGDTVQDDEAWYYDSKGEIRLWSEPEQ